MPCPCSSAAAGLQVCWQHSHHLEGKRALLLRILRSSKGWRRCRSTLPRAKLIYLSYSAVGQRSGMLTFFSNPPDRSAPVQLYMQVANRGWHWRVGVR